MLNTVKGLLQASTESPRFDDSTAEQSEGAYWCHDCDERILDTKVEGDAPPDCPGCDDEMEFERSPGSTGCAC